MAVVVVPTLWVLNSLVLETTTTTEKRSIHREEEKERRHERLG